MTKDLFWGSKKREKFRFFLNKTLICSAEKLGFRKKRSDLVNTFQEYESQILLSKKEPLIFRTFWIILWSNFRVFPHFLIISHLFEL